MKRRSRRQFLQKSVSGLSSVWLASHWQAILAAQQYAQGVDTSQPGRFQFFSLEQAAEVEAIAAQIIPGGESPGARDAHVVDFIDRILVTLDRDKQSQYIEGLKELRRRTRERFPDAKEFSALTFDQQIQLLTAVEKSDFFELVRFHTIVGFLARPEYGGNHDEVGWKLIGFEDQMTFEPPFGYYDREENKAP